MVGEPGVQKTLVFQALAGLWPWGHGRISLPSQEKVAFVPRRAHLPPGSLRAALAYPSAEGSFADEELERLAEQNGPTSAEAQVLAQPSSQRVQDLQVYAFRAGDQRAGDQ